MANALLAYEAHDAVRSQQLLDELFQLGARNPEAGVLRARIAIEQGNLPFALRFLEQQIRQSADHAGLRETLASALYLAGKPEESRTQLMAAKTLGAPVWRVAYGLGLIEESASRFEDARQRYEECLQAKPGWKPAESRLRGLLVAGRLSSRKVHDPGSATDERCMLEAAIITSGLALCYIWRSNWLRQRNSERLRALIEHQSRG